MSNTKQVKGVVLPRNDTAKNWSKALNFIPGDGELIVYKKDSIEDINRGYYLDDDGNTLDSVIINENLYSVNPSEVVRFKFGNGVDNVNVLPFATTGINPDVLEALATKGYVDNKLDTLAIKNTIYGGEKSLTVNDVSSITHKCSLRLTSDTYEEIQNTGESNNIYNFNEENMLITSMNGTPIATISYVVNDNGTLTFNGTTDTIPCILRIDLYNLVQGQTYTFSLRSNQSEYLAVDIFTANDWSSVNPEGATMSGNTIKVTFTVTDVDGHHWMNINCCASEPDTDGNPIFRPIENLILYPQLEYGDTMTDWAPYGGGEGIVVTKPYVEDFSTVKVKVGNKSYTPEVDGKVTDIMSVSPVMEITTDNEHVNIHDFTYNVDTKSYVDNNIPEVDLSDYYNKSEIDTAKVGLKTAEGGEIFNDYENNKAYTPFSHARGYNNIAGGKGFNILKVSKVTDHPQIKCRLLLDTYDDLDIGDIVSADITNNYTDFAEIIDISTTDGISLDTYPGNCNFVEGDSFLWINSKPLIGSVFLGKGHSVDGTDNVVIQNVSSSSGRDNVVGGKYGRASGRANFAGYSGHAQNRYNKAIGNDASASGYKTEAIGMESDSGNFGTKAIARGTTSRGRETVAGTRAFVVKEIDFENATEVLVEETLSDNSIIYYVGPQGDDANNNGTQSLPFKTVDAAIIAANAAGYDANDVIYVKLMYVKGVNNIWQGDGNSETILTKHSFTLNISSLDTKTQVGEGYKTTFNGPVEFSNVILGWSKSSYVQNFNGNNVTIGKGVSFNGTSFNTHLAKSGTFDKDITINFNGAFGENYDKSFYLGGDWGRTTFNGDIFINFNSPNAYKIFLSSNNGNSANHLSTFNGNINFNLKTITELTTYGSTNTNKTAYGPNAAVQIINSAGLSAAAVNTLKANLTASNRINPSKYFIVNNTFGADIIEFTKTAGKFKINLDRLVYGPISLVNIDDESIKSNIDADGFISITEPGIYALNAIERPNHLVTYYVSSTGSDITGTGSVDSSFATISKAIQEAKKIDMIQGDKLCIKVIGSSSVNWGEYITYPFKVDITSDNAGAVVNFDNNTYLGGITEFNNVKINIINNKDLFFNHNDVIIGSDVIVSSRNLILGPNDEPNTVDKDINLNFKSQTNTLILGSSSATTIFNKDINISYDYTNGTPIFKLGSGSNVKVEYNRHINFNLKSATSVNIGSHSGTIIYGEDSAIQVIDSTNRDISNGLQVLDNIINTKGEAVPYWRIINNSKLKDALDFTQEAGVFAVKKGYRATATNILGDIIETKNGLLDLSSNAGEYTVDVVETIQHIGKIQLDAIRYLGEYLAIGDLISIKDAQTFGLNAGTIIDIDDTTNTLSVEGYTSQMIQFLLLTDTYLFVLDKPKLGTEFIGSYSSANGHFTQTIGMGSHADGLNTISTADYQFSCGQYNKNKPDTVFEVGNGESEDIRNNALEVYKDGHVEIQTIGKTNNSVTTKGYVSNYVNNTLNSLAIQNTVNDSKKSLVVNDVSSLAHKCSCRLTSDTYEKGNLFKTDNIDFIGRYDATEFSSSINMDGSIYFKATYGEINNSSLRVGIGFSVDVTKLTVGKTYTFSITNSTDTPMSCDITVIDKNNEAEQTTIVYEKNIVFTFTVDEKYQEIYFCYYAKPLDFSNFVIDSTFFLQLEPGSEATKWEPYVEGEAIIKPYVEDFSTIKVTVNGTKYTPSADGTLADIISSAPVMNITTNNEHVNIVDFTYNIDTKKYIDNECEKRMNDILAEINDTLQLIINS